MITHPMYQLKKKKKKEFRRACTCLKTAIQTAHASPPKAYKDLSDA